uniref:SMB domain-containing protein n=1 Tax=Oncorhynchus kisutch TaxID=8019 RepID=A0A8C7L383_ONCKI
HSSCSGRCGGEYYRGYMCQCDYDCLTHEECCKDYESQCTTSDSCKGRCGQSFKRGRQCDCDPDCARYSKCCPDYKSQCGIEEKPKPSKPTGKPKPSPTRPSTLTDINQDLGTDNPRDYQAGKLNYVGSYEHNDTNICSGRPVGAVTTLRNGTVVVFRGHYFWVLDSNRVPGPARGITDVWGVPSPIDTVFTRCNCQGKTYFFKGSNYWRFENGMMEPGYPKLIRAGFDGLQGQITAALSVPEYRKRRESVYFFKRVEAAEGRMKYSYQSGISPTCGRKVHYSVYTVRNRVARQAAPLLGQEINIRLTWRGFPSTVTSAVSIPTHKKPEGYNYYLFSRCKYLAKILFLLPKSEPVASTPPVSSAPQKNSAKDFFNCPKEV